MALEFGVSEIRWERYQRVFENPHAKEWLKFQAARGLAANTLDAYGRDLDAYLGFLGSLGVQLKSVVRSTLGAYLRSAAQRVPEIPKNGKQTRATLANATLQQHLT